MLGTTLTLTCTLASSATLGKILGEERDPESILFWLLDFRDQVEQILEHHCHAGASKRKCDEDNGDVLLATQASETTAAALVMSRRCQTPKQEAELSIILLSERYQSPSCRTALPVEYGSNCFCRVLNSRGLLEFARDLGK